MKKYLLGGVLASMLTLGVITHNPATTYHAQIGDFGSEDLNFNTRAINILDNADENDTVILSANSHGGSVSEGVETIRAIQQSKAHVIYNVRGIAASMGAGAAAAADEVRGGQYDFILIHSSYFGYLEGFKILIDKDAKKDTSEYSHLLLTKTKTKNLNKLIEIEKDIIKQGGDVVLNVIEYNDNNRKNKIDLKKEHELKEYRNKYVKEHNEAVSKFILNNRITERKFLDRLAEAIVNNKSFKFKSYNDFKEFVSLKVKGGNEHETSSKS